MNTTALPRRLWLQGAAAGALAAWTGTVRAASPAAWLPYAPEQILRISPAPMRRIEPAPPQTRRGMAPLQPPKAYVRTGREQNVPAWLVYGVALQESLVRFGPLALPYPWTLCVSGRSLRFGSYEATLAALQALLRRGVTNVDCGAMQVNWRWHGDKLGSAEQALKPYSNLATGARILRGHFEERSDWRAAVALYHTGTDASAAARQRGARYASQTLDRLARMGVDVAGLLKGNRHV